MAGRTEPHPDHGVRTRCWPTRFLDGNLVVVPTPDGLIDLADPYDPVQNAPYRSAGMHDLVLYEGRLYSATGPTTGVLLHVPSRLLGLGDLNPNLATLLCAIGGFVASMGIFAELRRRYFGHLPLWVEIVTILGLGFGSPVFWLISIGRSYESAIACGYMLVFAGLYFLLCGVREPTRPNGWLLAAGSAALGAAVSARVRTLSVPRCSPPPPASRSSTWAAVLGRRSCVCRISPCRS